MDVATGTGAEMTQKQLQILELAKKSITNFDFLPNNEKMLQIVAILADKVKVREDAGKNRNYYIDDFLEVAGVPHGSPWCAAMLTWAADMLNISHPAGGASVANWIHWAQKHNLITKEPKRGDLCAWLNPNWQGHIGQIVDIKNDRVFSIEGNTSSGIQGSQRDGDGCYRRNRPSSKWQYFIKIV